MKTAKLIIDGKEIEVEITQEQLDKLCPPKKKTGYERTKKDKKYWYVGTTKHIYSSLEQFTECDTEHYDNANYYSDTTVALNNARADRLMRQLRRFAVEHREKELDWHDGCKFEIVYDYAWMILGLRSNCVTVRGVNSVLFDTKETAQLAIDTFKDDLLWYFTEYKDSL